MLRAPGPCIHGGCPGSPKDVLAPCPLPRSEGVTDLLGSFASRKIYLSIYNIYICVCLITTHPHAYTYCYSHSLTRAPAAAGLPRSPHLPRQGKDGKGNPVPWGCAFASSSPTPKTRGQPPLLVRKAAGRWELATSTAPCQTHLREINYGMESAQSLWDVPLPSTGPPGLGIEVGGDPSEGGRVGGAGTQVGAGKMALEKVVELVMGPNRLEKITTGGAGGIEGAQPDTAAALPCTARQGKSRTERGGKINPISRGGSRWPRHARLAKGEVNVEMLYPQ